MARMPGALWKPLPRGFTTPMTGHDIICEHTMVGSLLGTDGYFRRLTNGVNSHYGTGGLGEIWQWGDTRFRSGANLDGNPNIVTIENADMGPGFAPWNTASAANVPAFTPAQMEANARILAWESSREAHAACPPHWTCHKVGIPLVLIPDAKPGRRGIGYHRQGVPGYMVAGAVKWSNSTGKACPGDRRIAQIPQIIARAKQLVAGGKAPAPAPVQEDDMPYSPTELGNITSDAIANRVLASVGGKPYHAWEAWRDAGLKGVDAAKLAAEIVRQLPAPTASATSPNGLTRQDVESAVRSVFAAAADA